MHDRNYCEREYFNYKKYSQFYKAMVEYSVKFQEPVMMGFLPPSLKELKDAVKDGQPIRYKDDGAWY